MLNDEAGPVPPLTREDLKTMAAQIAGELMAASANVPDEERSGTGGGSLHRRLPEDLRKRFIEIRAALFQRGVFDPVLVRFDSATVAQATSHQIAEELAVIAESL